jgi:hypothetical protein
MSLTPRPQGIHPPSLPHVNVLMSCSKVGDKRILAERFPPLTALVESLPPFQSDAFEQ